jgi:serine/threonine protein kinase
MAHRGLNAVPSLNDFFYDDNPELRRPFPCGSFDSRERLDISGQTETIEIGSEPYLVMERIFGRNLRTLGNEMTSERLLVVARSVCRILERVHRERQREDGKRLSFIYMDLKPDNLIVDRLGGVTLVDFGASVPIVDGLRKGKGAYTPGFAAPEVRRLSHPTAVVDARADLYSLGAVLFWGLSRDHIDPMSLARPPEEEFPLLDLAFLRAGLPPSVRGLVSRALAREPDDRFRTAGEMREAIEAALREL